MPFFIKEKGFTIGVTKDDIEDYKKTHGGETYPLSFVQYLKDKMKLPYYQPVTIEAKYKDKQAYKEATKPGFTGTPSYLDLSAMDLSGLDLSDRDYDDSKSRIIFDNVKFGPKTGLSKTNFSGTTLKNIDLKSVPIASAIMNRHTDFEESCDLTEEAKKEIDKKKISSTVTWTHYAGSIILKISDEDIQAYRLAHVENQNKSTKEGLEYVEKTSAYYIKQELDSFFKEKKGWGKWTKSFVKSEPMEDAIKDIVIDHLEKGGYLRKQFLINKDSQSFAALLKGELKETIENTLKYAATLANKGKTTAEVVETLKKSEKSKIIGKKIESFKESQIKKEDRWQKLRSITTKHGKKIEETWIGTLSKKILPSSISPTETSSWPRISPDDIKAKERDLELKKEGLRIIAATLGAGAATATSARILTGGSVMGIFNASILGLTATGAVGYKFLEGKMTLENYDQFDSQFGDRLLEVAVAKKACEKTAALVAGNALNELVVTQIFTQSLATNTVKSVLKPLNALGQYALINNVKASYNFIQGEKNKVSYNRHRPGDPSFENSLNEKLFDTKTVLIYGAISGVLVGGFILSSVFAGPAIAPFMATIGALSATELTLAGGAALAILTTLGSTIHKKSKYYFNKLRNNLTKPKQAPTIPIGRGKEIPVDAIDKKTETPEHTKERPKDVEHTKEKEEDEFFDAVEHPETAKKIEKEKEEDKMKLEAAKKILKERKKTQSKLGKNVKRLIKQRENKQFKSVRRK